jgi:hypothetical protein
MKHAGADALNLLEPLLVKIRKHAQLKEKKRGLFYLKGKSFLHFHEDPEGLFADLFSDEQSWRLRVSKRAEQRTLLAKIAEVLSD